jgi:hypothetical protein
MKTPKYIGSMGAFSDLNEENRRWTLQLRRQRLVGSAFLSSVCFFPRSWRCLLSCPLEPSFRLARNIPHLARLTYDGSADYLPIYFSELSGLYVDDERNREIRAL